MNKNYKFYALLLTLVFLLVGVVLAEDREIRLQNAGPF